MSVQVRFNDLDEFVAELLVDRAMIRRSIVRVTTRRRALPELPRVGAISVLATARTGPDEILSLEVYCGEDWGPEFRHSNSIDVLAKARAIAGGLADRLEQEGLEVRAGRLE